MLNSNNQAEQISAEQLWQFSLRLYPKVKSLCLQWQDELGANVNMLLLLGYLEQRQLSMTIDELQQLAATLHQFSTQFTQPLRALRRNYQAAPAALQQPLQQQLLDAELALEQLEQQLLLQHCPRLISNPAPLLELYLQQLNAAPDAAQKHDIVDLRQAINQLQ